MARLNGAKHWRQTLDRILWMLLGAGIRADDISATTARILRTYRGIRSLSLPPPEVLEYARILTYWRNEPQFLDESGKPRALALTGGNSSFRALVRKTLPGCSIEDVLQVLRRHEVVSVTAQRHVRLKSSAFLPRAEQRALFVAHTLSALEGIVDTCYRNLNSRHPSTSIGRLQRVALAERFDLRYLEDYDLFLRDQAQDFLLKQDAWLKRHEAKSGARGKTAVAHVGVGIFGFRAR